MTYDLAVVGSGILGSFHAYLAARAGWRVLLLEQTAHPSGASVQNFGMVIPSAFPAGPWRDRGARSVQLYRGLCQAMGYPCATGGTQYLASTAREWQVLQEYAQTNESCHLLDASASTRLNAAIQPSNCVGSLHAPSDLAMEPAGFFQHFLPWLTEQCGVRYQGNTRVRGIDAGDASCTVHTDGGAFEARHVVVCPGAAGHQLFPNIAPLQLTKLQMLQTRPQAHTRLPTQLVSPLSLRRYDGFQDCPSHAALCATPVDDVVSRFGIHVLCVQRPDGTVVIGDSHTVHGEGRGDLYETEVEEAILARAKAMVALDTWEVAVRWCGYYGTRNGGPVARNLDARLRVVEGLGGRGMTAGPALAEETLAGWGLAPVRGHMERGQT